MNPERLNILQDLSKGSQIYFEESERRPEAINVDALMRATAEGQESSDWEMYVKKKIGENITLLKKFTPDGKVNVILDLRGNLSVSEYDFEAGKRVLGEGYLQISSFSSPIEVSVTEVSFIKNISSENPQVKGSSNLSDEYKEMFDKVGSAVENEDEKQEEVGEALVGVEVEKDQVTDLEESQEYVHVEDPNTNVGTHISPPATTAQEQAAADILVEGPAELTENGNESINTHEAINLAVASASEIFLEEMRKEREESEKRILEAQDSSKAQIEEINTRYADQIVELNQKHEDRLNDLLKRIENLEAEKDRLEGEIEKQKQDFETKLSELKMPAVSGDIVGLGCPEVEIFTAESEDDATQEPVEEKKLADEIIIDKNGQPRAGDGTFLSPKDFENKRSRKENNQDISPKTEIKDKSEVKTYEYKLENGWVIYSPRRIQNVADVKTAVRNIINSYEPGSMDLAWIESRFREELKKLKRSYTNNLLHQYKLIPPVLNKED